MTKNTLSFDLEFDLQKQQVACAALDLSPKEQPVYLKKDGNFEDVQNEYRY